MEFFKEKKNDSHANKLLARQIHQCGYCHIDLHESLKNATLFSR